MAAAYSLTAAVESRSLDRAGDHYLANIDAIALRYVPESLMLAHHLSFRCR